MDYKAPIRKFRPHILSLILFSFACLHLHAQENRIHYKDPYYVSKFITNADTIYTLNIHEIQEGQTTVYYNFNNQTKLIECQVLKGKINGPYRTWFREGNKKSEENYAEGDLDGPYVEWYNHGQIKSKGKYIHGLKDGFFEDFYAAGNLKFSGNFYKGNKEGFFTEYYENGNKRQWSEFIQDEISKINYWRENGNIQEKSTYAYHEMFSDSLFYDNGQVKKAFNLEKDPSGKIGYWNMEGKEITKEEFDQMGCFKIP